MILSGKRLQVHHYPQIGSSLKHFSVDVNDEHEAAKMINTLADQHIFLIKNLFIPDYSNSFNVVMWDGSEWVDYWNEAEQMNWDDLEAAYEDELTF